MKPKIGRNAGILLFVATLFVASAQAQTGDAGKAPLVVASTSWVAAFARAAGAANVVLVAPADYPHPPDYDPRPSDLAAVARAKYVLFAPFDGFVARIKQAAGSSAKLVPVDAENTPKKIHVIVTQLSKLFGTEAAGRTFLMRFDREHAQLSAGLEKSIGKPKPRVIAQVFMAYWADFAKLPLVGVYGPTPLQPKQLASLVAKHPNVIFKNGQFEQGNSPSDGRAIADATGAKQVEIINFPDADLNLLSVFEENAKRLRAALGASS